MATDNEIVDEKGWTARSLGFEVVCFSDLSGTVREQLDGDIIEVDSVPDFLKAMYNIRRMFNERYVRES